MYFPMSTYAAIWKKDHLDRNMYRHALRLHDNGKVKLSNWKLHFEEHRLKQTGGLCPQTEDKQHRQEPDSVHESAEVWPPRDENVRYIY